jgi:ribosome assembly protein 3
VASIPPQRQKPRDPEQAFEDFYLKQATKEFANDIDKLRSAPDFNERNVPILIRALRQGTACFSEEERRKIGAAGE